jgi:hypothetical protein
MVAGFKVNGLESACDELFAMASVCTLRPASSSHKKDALVLLRIANYSDAMAIM